MTTNNIAQTQQNSATAQKKKSPFDLEQWARNDWKSSGVSDGMYDANVKVIDGASALDIVLYSDKLPRTNAGRLASGILKTYDHLYHGGWFLSVLNPLADFSEDDWGCFKPIKPRTKHDVDGGINHDPIKYEHPPKEEICPYFLKVTARVWERIAQRHDVAMPELPEKPDFKGFDNSQISYGREFWEWAIDNNLPIIITEGAKKTASLLCVGYVAIGIPGVWNFSKKVEEMKAWETPLHDQLQEFFKRFDNPQITIAYDADSRPKTIRNVTKAAIRLAKKLQWGVNADVKIAKWHPELGKGIDDVFVTNGLSTVETILGSAIAYQTSAFLDHCRLTYPVNHKVNQRYLGEIPEFTQKIVGIKSPKGTGKTSSLADICQHYTRQGKRVIVLTHRRQLASELGNRFGIEFLNEIESEDQWLMASLQGFALCIDSLHPGSKAKFDLSDNRNFDEAIVIVDESEQNLNHLVGSSTCKNERAEIVAQLEMLCENADKIILSDADLSDYSVEFFRNLAKLGKSDVAIIQNKYRFTDSAWNVSLYSEGTPDRLLLETQTKLQQGERILFFVSGQKTSSLYSAQNIRERLAPYCQGKTLVIDSVTVGDREDEAFGIVSKLNGLKDYQLVVATPVIETGISIEADLFDAVFCISWGMQSVQSVFQAIARYRRSVPRHVWVPNRPANMMKEGGVVSKKQLDYLMTSSRKRERQLKKELGAECFTNGLYEPWLESVVRFNLGHQAYRENLETLLVADGHRVTKVDPMNITDETIRQIRDAAYQADVENRVNADTPSDLELETLNNSAALTKTQRYQQQKGNLIKTYGQCSEAMVKADDDGCFKKLQLLYYLTVGRNYLQAHDQRVSDRFTAKNQKLHHEISKSSLGVKVAVLENLGIAELLDGQLFSNEHPVAQIIDNVNPTDFLATFGRKLSCRGSLPSRRGDRINTFLELLGFKKEEVCRKGSGPNEKRYYRVVQMFEGIDYQEIFGCWLERDRTLNPQLSESLNETTDAVGANDDAIEADMWSLFFEAIAHDCLPEVWQSIKAMGQKWAEKVHDQFSDLVQQLDPEWTARWAF